MDWCNTRPTFSQTSERNISSTSSFAPSDSSVRTVGSGTAIVSGRMRVKGAINGTPYETELLYTETWLKTGARRRLVARHASRAPER